MKPMLLTDAGTDAMESVINNDAWVLQEKFDGIRILARYGEFGWRFYGRQGEQCGNAQGIKALQGIRNHLDDIRMYHNIARITLDGELVGDKFHVFDIVQTRGGRDLFERDVEPSHTWTERNEALLTLSDGMRQHDDVLHVASARTTWMKRDLWETVQKEGGEGVVSKRKDSPYVLGVRATVWQKHKITREADVFLDSVDKYLDTRGRITSGSAMMYVNDRFGPLYVGRVSLVGKDGSLRNGDVATVRYLNMSKAGVLIQPRIIGKRFDKSASECSDDQFDEKG